MAEVFALSPEERQALTRVHGAEGPVLYGPVLAVAAHASSADTDRLQAVLASVVATAEASETLLEAMHTVQELPGPATLRAIRDREQAWRDVEARYGLLTSRQVGTNAGSTAPAEWASRWLRERRVLAVKRGGRNLFPGFQFDRRGQVVDGLGPILEAFDGAGWDAESVMLWFAAPHAGLGDTAPADRLGTGPHEVLEAARDALTPL